MKKFFLIGLFIAGFWAVVWQLRYFSLFDFSEEDQKLFIITANLKWLVFLATYIAWRVTPDPKRL